MAKQSPTSITVASLEKFLAKNHEGTDRPQLRCKKIPGLHVIELKSGAASWRLNYCDVDGNRVRHTIGNARVMTPPQAAEQATLIRGDLIQDKSPGKGRKAKQAERQSRPKRLKQSEAPTLTDSSTLVFTLRKYIAPTK